MAGLGDTLRGLGSALNPEVYRTVEAENMQQNDPTRLLHIQQLQNEVLFRQGIQKLGPSPKPDDIANLAMQFGKPEVATTILNHKEANATRLQLAHDTIQQRMDALQQRAEDQTLNRQSREAIAAQTAALREQQLGLSNEMRRMGLDLRSQNLDLRNQMFENTQEQQLQNQTTKFANTLQQNKVPQLASSMTSANDLLKKYEGGSIPGFGAVSGSSAVPNLLRGEEAKNVRSAVQGVTNDLLNMYSGLAVTLPESERRSLEQMNRGDFTEADFRNAWPRVVNRFNSVMGSLKAGANPKAVEKYQSQPGAIRLEPITAAFGKSETQTKSVFDKADEILKGK
jgi:hypothetical protein